jgi:hypothetical protein
MKPLLKHTALEFKQNEIKTLEYIDSRGFFYSDFADLATAINVTYNKYRGIKKEKFDFYFVSDFEIEIESSNYRIVVHAELSGDYEFTTYSIGICGDNNSNELIRRFHFDYDHNNLRKKQKAFISHLQYGGKSGIGFSGTQYNTNNIEDWLSEPRLNFPPVNLALLLDIIFCEFPNDKTNKITENPDWRSLILNNEEFILKQYFKSISNHIGSDRHNKYNLVRDICYA